MRSKQKKADFELGSRIYYPELEATLSQTKSDGIELAQEHGADLASNNQPNPDESATGYMYYRKIHSTFQNGIHEIRKVVQNNGNLEVRTINKVYDAKEARIKRDLEDVQHNLGIAEREVKKSEKKGWHLGRAKKRRLNAVRILCVFLNCADSIFSYRALAKAGLTPSAAFFVSIIIGICFYAGAEALPFLYSKIKTRRMKIVFTVLLGMFLIAAFSGLAYMRTASGQGNAMLLRISFVLINLLIFSISASLIFRFHVSKKVRNDLTAWEELKKKESDLTARKMKLDQELLQAVQDRETEFQNRRAIRQYVSDLEKMVCESYRIAFSVFTESNVMNRKDGRTPIFFNFEPKTLVCNYLKKNINYDEINYN